MVFTYLLSTHFNQTLKQFNSKFYLWTRFQMSISSLYGWYNQYTSSLLTYSPGISHYIMVSGCGAITSPRIIDFVHCLFSVSNRCGVKSNDDNAEITATVLKVKLRGFLTRIELPVASNLKVDFGNHGRTSPTRVERVGRWRRRREGRRRWGRRVPPSSPGQQTSPAIAGGRRQAASFGRVYVRTCVQAYVILWYNAMQASAAAVYRSNPKVLPRNWHPIS